MNSSTLTAAAALGLLLAAGNATAQHRGQQPPLTAPEIERAIRERAVAAVGQRDIPPGYYLLDGDMQMPVSFNPTLDGFYLANTWPGGVVPYTFDVSVSASDRAAVQTAMATWHSLANLTFVQRTVQADYVYIQTSTGNNSAVGHQGGPQIINYAAGQPQSVLTHELGHCLGFLHEQQRPDRLITVQPCNVQGVTCNGFGQVIGTGSIYDVNFPIISTGSVWAPYDFASVMHYDRCAFSIGCPPGFTCNCASNQETMTVVEPYHDQWNSVIGNASGPSYLDGFMMRALYPQGGDRWIDRTWFGAQQATFQNPYNGAVTGYSGFTPAGGVVIFKAAGVYHGVGTYSQPATFVSPAGVVTIGS